MQNLSKQADSVQTRRLCYSGQGSCGISGSRSAKSENGSTFAYWSAGACRKGTIWRAGGMPRKLVMTHRLWTGILPANWTVRCLVACARDWRGRRKGRSDTAPHKVLVTSGRIGQYGLVHYIGREIWQKVTGRCWAMPATGAVGGAAACRRAGQRTPPARQRPQPS
jgi:hypothetical protein